MLQTEDSAPDSLVGSAHALDRDMVLPLVSCRDFALVIDAIFCARRSRRETGSSWMHGRGAAASGIQIPATPVEAVMPVRRNRSVGAGGLRL